MKRYILLFIASIPILSIAQVAEVPKAFSLDECIEYALENAVSLENARLDEASANARVKETVGIGLPQVSANVRLSQSPTQPRFFSQYRDGQDGFSFISSEQADQLGMEDGDVFAAKNFFQLKGAGDASLSINQLIFNGSYIVGLQASQAYKDLSIRQKDKTEGDVKVDVSKAYFNVLINRERLDLYDKNLERLDSLYRNTKAMYENGFAESIDVDRLKVTMNNLISERENMQNLNILSMRLLKFQMNYPLDEPLELSGSFEDILSVQLSGVTPTVTYADRPDYQVLLANKRLQELNLKNKYAEALPTIGAFANLGYSTQSPDFGGLFKTESGFSEQGGVGPDQWYGYSTVGLSLNWNLFTGLQRNFQIQQQKIELEKIENNLAQFESMIEVEVREADLTMKNALKKLNIQKENVELAERVFNITQEKYEQGVGSNLEVVEADSDLKEAQTNFYNAVFEAVLAKIDLDSATGKITD